MTKSLTQVIVNTSGLARTLIQDRDSKGRFAGKARVTTLINPKHALHLAYQQSKDLVIVHHGYSNFQQVVTSVNPKTGDGNAVVFNNDGVRGGRICDDLPA